MENEEFNERFSAIKALAENPKRLVEAGNAIQLLNAELVFDLKETKDAGMAKQLRLRQAKMKKLEGIIALTAGNWDKAEESFCEAFSTQESVLNQNPTTGDIIDLLEYIFNRVKEYHKRTMPNRLR